MDDKKIVLGTFILSFTPLIGMCAFGIWIIDMVNMHSELAEAQEILAMKIDNNELSYAEISNRLRLAASIDLRMGEDLKLLNVSYYLLGIVAICIAFLQVEIIKYVLNKSNI